MTTKTEVCNYALVVHLGADPITSFGETTSKNGRLCNRVYVPVLKELLEEHPWQFAKRTYALSALSDQDPAEWEYAYTWPSNCLMPREVQRSDRAAVPIDFEVMNSIDDTNKKTICCNEEDAVLIYTAYLDNPNLYSASFRKALSLALAVAMCPTSAPKKKIDKLENQALIAKLEAQSTDTKTRSDSTEPACEFLTARS